VPAGDGWFKIQLKSNEKYIDAYKCLNKISLNPSSTYDGGSCQLWRFVSAGDGWFRIQLKNNSEYIDAYKCSTRLDLNPVNFDDGS